MPIELRPIQYILVKKVHTCDINYIYYFYYVLLLRYKENNFRRLVFMAQHFIKNIDFAKVIEMDSLVDYKEGQVVSRTLSQGKNLSLTLFAFDKGEEISSHSSGGDALVYVLDGNTEITIGEEKFNLKKGETIVMPAGVPHALYALDRFKMLLVVVFNS